MNNFFYRKFPIKNKFNHVVIIDIKWQKQKVLFRQLENQEKNMAKSCKLSQLHLNNDM